MKLAIKSILASGALFLAGGTESRALSPRQHAVSGVIARIDHTAHTITLAPSKGDKPVVFVWTDRTRYSLGWRRLCLGALEPGQSVRISYRSEIGRLVPRRVSLRKETPMPRTCGGYCAKRS